MIITITKKNNTYTYTHAEMGVIRKSKKLYDFANRFKDVDAVSGKAFDFFTFTSGKPRFNYHGFKSFQTINLVNGLT